MRILTFFLIIFFGSSLRAQIGTGEWRFHSTTKAAIDDFLASGEWQIAEKNESILILKKIK
jgi:hypothetical protein